ncbi:RNA 2',3'-cyclic phosphodiesterase [Sunxiuqinia elliptica]|uniref:RNA 2',3'-cyclic phosphodiesterase n=1 Tax=Sunxiuqinia elliptica TaxID=655355 RepID=A0A1I2ACT0_9BACT|nr:RNA 2',3'-cyclic phosphodiesterase [Sunxiuqinia elliptica]SFE40640.1 2'-5' RNA ligase [Sunxiuqinia elliptica]
MTVKRVFIAVRIKPYSALKEALRQLDEALRNERIRWVAPGLFHVTLRFLGSISDEKIEAVKSLLADFVLDKQAFSFKLKGFGFFSHKGSPSVIFQQVDNADLLTLLSQELKVRLKVLGVTTSEKYTPHLTLGRMKKLKDLQAFQKELANWAELPERAVDVSEIRFYESELTSSGSVYRLLGKYPLQNPIGDN